MEKQELAYQATKFNLDTYWVDPIADFGAPSKRPLAIICPGGGFKFLTDREAQPIAFKFNALGMHALVLDYQLVDDNQTVYPLALQELATTLNWLQSQDATHHIDLDKIVLVGFSAGSHVVANFNSIMLDAEQRVKIFADDLIVKPAANILCYPVIDMTLGWPEEDWAMKIAPDIYYWQAQEHLTEKGKPTFIWQTVTDATVPVMNSILYAQKMDLLQIPYEIHLFGSGAHGLSLANYITQNPGNVDNLNAYDTKWWELCVNWLKLQAIIPNR